MSSEGQVSHRALSIHLSTILLLSACGPTLHPVPDIPITDPDVLLQRFADHRCGFGDLSAVARLRRDSKQGVIKGRITILARLDGRLRVDGWTPTDSLVATLTAGPEAFRYFERDAEECLRGKSCPENLALLLPVGLEVRETAGFLFGIPPVPRNIAEWTLLFDRKTGAYELGTVLPDGGAQKIWIREDGVPLAAERVEKGKRVYRMEASEFERTGGGHVFPMKVSLHASRFDTSLTVRYRSVDLDPDIREEDWDFPCPDGVTERIVHCREP